MKTLPIRRGGFTLLEMLTTITVLTILLMLCAGLIKLLLKLDQTGRDAMNFAADQVRLARAFRDDAHQSDLTTPPNIHGDRLSLILPEDNQVEYLIRPFDMLRELRQGGKVRHREIFRRPPRTSIRFELWAEGGRPMLSILTHREVTQTSSLLEQEDRIEAEVGRFERLIARKP